MSEALLDLSDLDWHRLSPKKALGRLGVVRETGLHAAEAQRRAAQYGANRISLPPRRMLPKVVGWVFGDFGSLLLAASIFFFIAWKPLGNPNPQKSNLALAVILFLFVILQVAFNAWQEFTTSRIMASIQCLQPDRVAVLRDGAPTSLPAASLVPGDIVSIVAGQKVPADVKLIDIRDGLWFDRSVLTGESEPISGRLEKSSDNILETKNIVLQGTLCVSGSGFGLVFQVGNNTVFGRKATKLASVASSSSMTSLQREILQFILLIFVVAAFLTILVRISDVAWPKNSYPYIKIPTGFANVTSVIVAFLPEGLPTLVMLCLFKTAHTLSKYKVLCKSLSIIETLGSVNVLCSVTPDMGRLTQNKMRVEAVAVYDDVTSDLPTLRQAPDWAENLRQLPAVSAICNAAFFKASPSDSRRNIIGDATDSAILKWADDLISTDDIRAHWRDVYKIPFNSKTGYMLTISKAVRPIGKSGFRPAPLASWDLFDPGDFLLCVKGAPDVLLPHCTHFLAPGRDGPSYLTDDDHKHIAAIQRKWIALGHRVFLLARRVVPREDHLKKEIDPSPESFKEHIDELTIVGLIGVIDPVRPDITQTVHSCQAAGIRFFVVTGDHPDIAIPVATQAGIISNPASVHHASDLMTHIDDNAPPQSIVITGAEFETLTPEKERALYAYKEIVFARTTLEQKLRIVRSMQARDGIVAVTGDDVSDVPALRAADCGIAMGSGSDIAREAADIVLLEDFSAIVVALRHGRLVFDNLQKMVLYLLPAGSFSELVPLFLRIVIGIPQMLSKTQMILICIVTDIPLALSMCFEPPEPDLLSRPPRNVRTEHLASGRLLLQACVLGIIESLCAILMSFWYLQRNGVPFSSLVLKFGDYPATLTSDLLHEAQSVYFFTLVVMQWGNLLSTRTRRSSIFQQPPWRVNRKPILAAACALVIVAVFFSYVPFFHGVFKTSDIPARYFLIPMTFALALIVLDETRKLIICAYPRSFVARWAW